MRMIVMSVFVLSACGGTWSNKDLEFAAALPSRAELVSKLPQRATTTQPLTRRDGLNAGEPSQAYADTRQAVNDFNGLLNFFLGVLDNVRQVPPTSRTETTRTWGPFTAKDNPGFQFQVVVSRVESETETYGWKVQARKLGEVEFFDLVRGAFKATADVRKGQGVIEVPVKTFRDRLTVDDTFRRADLITIGYFTEGSPRLVNVAFTFAAGNPGGLSEGGYGSKEDSDGSGAMAYTLSSPGNADIKKVTVASRWKSDGAGLSVGLVDEGTAAGATRVECWDAAFKVVWFKESFPGGQESGRQADCAIAP